MKTVTIFQSEKSIRAEGDPLIANKLLSAFALADLYDATSILKAEDGTEWSLFRQQYAVLADDEDEFEYRPRRTA